MSLSGRRPTGTWAALSLAIAAVACTRASDAPPAPAPNPAPTPAPAPAPTPEPEPAPTPIAPPEPVRQPDGVPSLDPAGGIPGPIGACVTDADCRVSTTCCAHCSPDGKVYSYNRRYFAYVLAPLLAESGFYCPACEEMGCVGAPRRTAICRSGRCAHRAVWTDATGRTTAVEASSSALDVELTPQVERAAQRDRHVLTRRMSCAGDPGHAPLDEPPPTHFPCAAAVACLEAIDALPCDVLLSPDGETIPACEGLDQRCPSK